MPINGRGRGRRVVGVAIGAIAISGMGVAVAVGNAIPWQSDPGASAPIPLAQGVDSTLLSNMGAFRRARQGSDALPPWALSAMATRIGPSTGANATLSRSVDLGAAGVIYLVPGNGEICGIAPGFMGCGPTAALAAYGLDGMNRLGTDPPHTGRFTGIVPDDVTSVSFTFANQSPVAAALKDNAYGVILHAPPSAIVFGTASGAISRPLNQAEVRGLIDGR